MCVIDSVKIRKCYWYIFVLYDDWANLFLLLSFPFRSFRARSTYGTAAATLRTTNEATYICILYRYIDSRYCLIIATIINVFTWQFDNVHSRYPLPAELNNSPQYFWYFCSFFSRNPIAIAIVVLQFDNCHEQIPFQPSTWLSQRKCVLFLLWEICNYSRNKNGWVITATFNGRIQTWVNAIAITFNIFSRPRYELSHQLLLIVGGPSGPATDTAIISSFEVRTAEFYI